MPSLIIACVKHGETYHAEYANILFDMARRHLPHDFTFMCFTDDAAGLHPDIVARELPGDLHGWWNKLYLFKDGVFPASQMVLYFDLDTLITGPLAGIISYQGNFALLRDFYRAGGYGSGVMLWQAGACAPIWESFAAAGKPALQGGDQAWIEKAWPHADVLQDIFPGAFVSYKTHCHPLPPAGACVVSFHGEPKQDNCMAPWVADIWKMDGAKTVGKAALGWEEERGRRMRHAAGLPYPWISALPAHTRHAMIAGNGASLPESLDMIRGRGKETDVFAAGGAALILESNNIAMDAHVVSEKSGISQLPGTPQQRYYASSCAPSLFEEPLGNVTLWNHQDILPHTSTTGLCTLRIAFLLGYRRFHLVGFDGCYRQGERRNNAERISTLTLNGMPFRVTPWMVAQAREFALLADELVKQYCIITVSGDGLIPFVSKKLVQQ